MDELRARLEEQMKDLGERIEGMDRRRDTSSNVNTVKIEGAGSIWNGLAVGIALGAVIVGGAWIVSTQQRLEMLAEQSKAYSAAVYALSPRFAEQIDKELDKQKEVK